MSSPEEGLARNTEIQNELAHQRVQGRETSFCLRYMAVLEHTSVGVPSAFWNSLYFVRCSHVALQIVQ